MVSTGYIGSGRPADVVLSPDGARIYAAETDGHVRVYSAETGELITEWDVGTRLGGIDLSPDGKLLYVVEREPIDQYISPNYNEYWKNWAIVTFYEVDITTGAIVSHPTRFTMSEDGFFDIAAQPDGNVLLSTSLIENQDGWGYLRLWQADTRRYLDLQGINPDSVLSPTLAGSKVLIGDRTGPVYIYNNEWVIAWSLAPATQTDNLGLQAYSENGKFAAGHRRSDGLRVYDSDLDFLIDLSAFHGGRFSDSTISGLAFDAEGKNLYVLDNETDSIVQISTSTWKIVRSIPVGVDFGLDPATAAEADYGNRLLVGPNARYFTVVTDTRLRIVENPSASETTIGTAAAETLRGSGLVDVLKGLDGGDLLLGGDADDRLEGGAGPDRLYGGAGADILEAGAGYDKLFGGAGNDLLRGDLAGGSAGEDGFYFDTAPSSTGNRDTIVDFQPGRDLIYLDAAIFGEAGPAGPLAADAYRIIGVGTADAEDRIIYDRAAGILSYDRDGNGAAAAVQFARVTPGLALSSADFAVYGTAPAPPPPPQEPANHGVSPLSTRYLGTHVSAGVVLSPDGSLVYAAGQDGFVRVFSAETGKLVKSWDVGSRLGGVDLSPDGRHLWVVEHKPLFQKEDPWDSGANRAKVTVYRVDTATGAAKSYPIVMTNAEDGFWDVAALADGTVLLSVSILHLWSGHANLRLLDPATGSYTSLDLRPTWDAILTPGDSATRVLIGEMHTSGSYVRLYRDGEYLAGHSNSPEFHSGLQAYNEQAKLVAQHTFTGGIYIFDDQLRLKVNISDLHDGSFGHREIAGLAFDASGQFLFVLDNVTDSIIQIAVADGEVIRFIPVGVDFEEASGPLALDPLYGDRLLVGPDARFFTVVVGGRLRIVLNPFASDTIAGTDAAETLQGTGLADILQGLGGDDVLVGGKGDDRLEGGAGNDVYRADSGDATVEADGGGVDRVETASSHVLADFVDNLTLLGSADAAAAGNALANVLIGNAGSNRLDGRAGADTMLGGSGDDIYVVDLAPADPAAARDVVVESAGGGTDRVESTVSYELPDQVEHLTITGSAARNGTGNSLGNSLTGNNAVNILSGRAGNDALRGAGGGDSLRGGAGDDRLFGGTGKDSLRGDTGADRFHFDTSPNADHRDRIEDFQVGVDRIALAATAFTQAGAPGTLAADAFRTVGAGSADAEDRILYDPALGAIYYDRDGVGAAAPILFATVTPGLALTSADFIVY